MSRSRVVVVFQSILNNMMLKTKTFLKKVKEIVDDSKDNRVKYRLLNRLFDRQFPTPPSVPVKDGVPVVQPVVVSEFEKNREALRDIVPVLKRIYIDSATREIFPTVMGNSEATMMITADFIEFLEKVTKDKDNGKI